MDLVTELPSESLGFKRAYKYPFVASQVLSFPEPSVQNLFFAHKDLLTKLLGVLYFEELNETIAGYVVQVAESLLKFDPGTFCSFVYQNSLGERMLWHLHNSSVAELLLGFLVSETEVKERCKILNLLVKQLRNSKDFIPKNASFILCEIIHQIGSISSWETLIREFMRSVDFVFECFFEESNTEALEVLTNYEKLLLRILL